MLRRPGRGSLSGDISLARVSLCSYSIDKWRFGPDGEAEVGCSRDADCLTNQQGNLQGVSICLPTPFQLIF